MRYWSPNSQDEFDSNEKIECIDAIAIEEDREKFFERNCWPMCKHRRTWHSSDRVEHCSIER